MSTTPVSSSPRGIDHVVIATRNLESLADRYRNLGFQVGQRNRHPWGTENHIVQFDGSFLELISVENPGLIVEPAPKHYSFGAFLRDYLKGGEGAAMLALESSNVVGDAEAFRLSRIGDFELFHFERSGAGPDGQPVKVAFSLAFAQAPLSPRAGFFVCQQHHPENFWNPARQLHQNTAHSVASTVLVTEDPSDFHEFLGHFINQRVMRATSFGLELDTGRGLVEVLSPEGFAFRFGTPAPVNPGNGLAIAAIQFRVGDMVAASKAGGVALVRRGDLLIVPAKTAGGVLLAFSA